MSKRNAGHVVRLTEKQFMAQVVKLAALRGWLVYHVFDSRRSVPGFPDLVMLRGDRLLVAELKVAGGRVTDAQSQWLCAFKGAGVDARLWTPEQWKEIEETLA